ncbi:coiled-coil domain-containing protein 86-like [Plakobranchus ocellatus]|uniref:Coiled-coil domain-containing protein 86 n=1 Tax=Plakobranchus ocellatus TaxID=259542 RepID=A0AAV4AI63_9GAST|nr:coiled-coil domain-containing protein 86-like [Plakobranchus ocellatus]
MEAASSNESQSIANKAKQIFHEIPRGKPKSGRGWKTTRTERHSTIKKVKRFKTSWAEKMSLKDQKRQTKELQVRLKEQKDRAKQLKRERAEENRRKKLENQRKAEIVQPIKHTAKIKKMKKKQLRMIETR